MVFILKAAAGGRDEEEAEGLIQQVPGMDFEAHPKPKCSTYIHRAKHHESVATYHWLSDRSSPICFDSRSFLG